MDSIEIQQFSDSHLDAVCSLTSSTIKDNYSAHYPNQAIEYFLGLYKPENILEKSQKGAICIAVVAKEIVGTGSLIGAEISGVFVSMRMQRKGIGLKIMAHLEALARETGNNSVSLSVSLPSFQFYKALGYMNFKEASIDLGCNQKLNYWRASKSLI